MKCPVCKSTQIRKTKNLYYQCGECSAYYLIHMPPDSFLNQRIRTYGKTLSKEITNTKLDSVIRKRLHTLASFIPAHASILDVGSGMGQFILHAKSQGYNTSAMDKAKTCIAYVRKKGIRGYTDLSDVPNGSFDAVTFFDVVEHVKNPHAFLEEIKKKLKSGGVIMVTTPNMSGITNRVAPNYFTRADGMYSEHVILYTMQALTKTLSMHGFLTSGQSTDMLVPSCTIQPPVVGKIVNKLMYLALSPFFSLLFNKGLGDNLEIIASEKR